MNKVLAMLVAACIVLAMVVPSVMANPTSEATVNNVDTTYALSANYVAPTPGVDGGFTATLVATDNNGDEDISGPYTISWTDEDGSHSVTLTETDPDGSILTKTFTGAGTVRYYQTDAFTVTADGTGTSFIVTPAPISGLEITNVNFNVVDVGSSVKANAIVTNIGNAPVTINPIETGDMIGSTGDSILAEFVVPTLTSVTVSDYTGTPNPLNVEFTLNTQIGTLAGVYTGTVTFTV